jgi:3-methyladenine DNA glycosylase AlkC
MPEKLKDLFFTKSSINAMATELKKLYRKFDKKLFTSLVLDDNFESLELKARMRHITECMHQVLPSSFPEAIKILRKAAPKIKGFEAMCLPDYVELYGLDFWDLSMEAMALFTKYSSSEFAIRPYIIEDPKRAMAFMKNLASDKDHKVRRFASEGCRPRLPWAMALPVLKKDPSPILPILEQLKNDDSEFVRRSVANNLNDISKDHPGLVLDICKKWFGESDHTDRIVKHACRTMLKQGDSRAMMLFGFGNPKDIKIKKLRCDKTKIKIGDKVQFTFVLDISGKKTNKVRLEYMVHFVKSGGKMSTKVFKISENNIAPGEHTLIRNHSFKNMSTRKHYPGEHKIAIIVNGVEKAQTAFMLTK